jgi:hypothetical protein
MLVIVALLYGLSPTLRHLDARMAAQQRQE